MFEKPANTMLRSLDKISSLPPETPVWPGKTDFKRYKDLESL